MSSADKTPTFYQAYGKRAIDVCLSVAFLGAFWWVLAIIAVLVRVNLGSPVLFRQPRPGKGEKIFEMLKFRTMTDACDAEGNPLPDEVRLTSFGRALRASSLDELPEVINILRGDMSIIGPRPQLVRDMVFMSEEQRMRHTAKPGLTGLAQVMGRNAITWEKKLEWDLKYIEEVSFLEDAKILLHTVTAVFKRTGITDGENATALDYGDTLLKSGRISKEQYDVLQVRARDLIKEYKKMEQLN